MKRLLVSTLVVILILINQIGLSATESSNPIVPPDSNQMVLVIGANLNDLHARIYLCQKKKDKGWAIDKNFPAVCGKKGWAWGLGIYPTGGIAPFNGASELEPMKQEGDLRSPIGVFQFGECMGYAPKLLVNSKLTYRQLTEAIQGVDDPASVYYNQVVDLANFPEGKGIDWKSFERMRRKDDLYKWLLVIQHNPENLRGKGSLIFLHVWRNADSGTAGCTATAEANLLEIMKWLDPEQNPVLVQLPEELYQKNLEKWGLPEIAPGKNR